MLLSVAMAQSEFAINEDSEAYKFLHPAARTNPNAPAKVHRPSCQPLAFILV